MAKHAGSDDDDIDWNSDDEREIDNFFLSPSPSPAPHRPEPGASSAKKGYSTSSSKAWIIDHFKGMGFTEEMIIKAMRENDNGEDNNMDAIGNTLLDYAEAEKLRKHEKGFDIDLSSDDEESPNQNYSEIVGVSPYFKKDGNSITTDKRFRSLLRMGYPSLEASIAIERCGEDADLAELTDFICAAEIARQSDELYADEPVEEQPRLRVKKRGTAGCGTSRGRKEKPFQEIVEQPIRLPNPMVGFGVPNGPGTLITDRDLPAEACGPPYFYYENVAFAPKGVWNIISRCLYGVEPEFVDSQYFSAAARKRGYVHNLPINGRFLAYPLPKYSIFEALPDTERWWPYWDKRVKLNCITTRSASAKVPEKISKLLEDQGGIPRFQKPIIDLCKAWNLVWVGRNKVAPLEPDEIENLLGFPRNHTRGGGISRTDRFKSLGNSFQVDTVAYHLSVLKDLFPGGIRVLSLFSGIGGAEVALHRLGIPMKVVVSVESSKVNRDIMKSFWDQTNQQGKLLKIRDVQELDDKKIEALMRKYGVFDLVIGGSPCNNLAGSNRVSRNGLEGNESRLFYDYARILKIVRDKAAEMRGDNNIINID